MKLRKVISVFVAMIVSLAAFVSAEDYYALGLQAEKRGANVEALTYFLKACTANRDNADAEKHMMSALYAVADGKHGTAKTSGSNAGADAQTLMKLRNDWDALLTAATEFVARNEPVFELRYYENVTPLELTAQDYDNNTMSFAVYQPYFKQYCPLENDEIMQILDVELRKIDYAKNWGKKINGFPDTYIDELPADVGNWLKNTQAVHSFDVMLMDQNDKVVATKTIKYTIDFERYFTGKFDYSDESTRHSIKIYSGFSITSDNVGAWGERYNYGDVADNWVSEGELEEVTFSSVSLAGVDTSKLHVSVKNSADSKAPLFIGKAPKNVVPLHLRNKTSGKSIKLAGRLNSRGGGIRTWYYFLKSVNDYDSLDLSNGYGLFDCTSAIFDLYHVVKFKKQNIVLPDGVAKLSFEMGTECFTVPSSLRCLRWWEFRNSGKITLHFRGSKQLWDHLYAMKYSDYTIDNYDTIESNRAELYRDKFKSIDFLYEAKERKQELIEARKRCAEAKVKAVAEAKARAEAEERARTEAIAAEARAKEEAAARAKSEAEADAIAKRPITEEAMSKTKYVVVGSGSFACGGKNYSVGNFVIGATEVTQELYETVTGENPSVKKGLKLPVETVSWFDAAEFCNRLSRIQGLTPCYSVAGSTYTKINGDVNASDIRCDFSANGWRLPTPKEWYYAAIGGNRCKFYGYSGSNSIDEVAWYARNSDGCVHEVAGKKANELGLHDMSGNVSEWGWYKAFGDDNVVDKILSSSEVCFGGCYADKDVGSICNNSNLQEAGTWRLFLSRETKDGKHGFRIIRNADGKESSVASGWIGMGISSPNSTGKEELCVRADINGICVSSVFLNGPAMTGGVQAGDFIIEVNGRNISDSSQFVSEINKFPAGYSCSLTLLRGMDRIVVSVVLGEKPSSIILNDNSNWWPDFSFYSRKNDMNVQGVVISSVPKNSSAASMGLEVGDVITSVNGKKTANLRNLYDALDVSKNKTFYFEVYRNGKTFTTSSYTIR